MDGEWKFYQIRLSAEDYALFQKVADKVHFRKAGLFRFLLYKLARELGLLEKK